ncbi:DUF3592 domain-containing protein [Actinoplanes sp. NPDC049265]|uniref:DUF3592 domain-containing protein n=1 Tax=Actinoplanes sp. NPDC049265 TaxID=3363902 RepID=UPI00371F7963
MRSGIRGGVILTLFGLLFVALAVGGHMEFFGYPGEATGGAKVVAVDPAGRGTTYTLRFTTRDGREVTADARQRRGGGGVVGDTVGIAYDTGDPDDVRVRSNLLIYAYLAGGVGLFLMANGVAAVVRRRPVGDSRA